MKISYGELKQYTEEMHGIIQNINEILENVSSINNQILRSECWVGEASDFYVNKLKGITSCFDELYLELDKSTLYLDKVVSGYESVDTNAVSASRGVGNIVKNTVNRLN